MLVVALFVHVLALSTVMEWGEPELHERISRVIMNPLTVVSFVLAVAALQQRK